MKIDEVELKRLRELYNERIMRHDLERPGYAHNWGVLSGLILTHGGKIVCPPSVPEDQLSELLSRGFLRLPHQIITRYGEPCECHGNTSELWLAGEIDYIETGYGLDVDGMWHQHTWGIKDDEIVETTHVFERYFGFQLNNVEHALFTLSNVDPHNPAIFESKRLANIAEEAIQWIDEEVATNPTAS